MIIYGIIMQTESDISCHSVYTDSRKRDNVLKELIKTENLEFCLYYSFNKPLTTRKRIGGNEMKRTLKGYTAHFTDEVGINRCFKMNAYLMDDVITEIKRIYGSNVYIFSCKSGAVHGKGN